MDIETIALYIGIVSGTITILGLIYGAFRWIIRLFTGHNSTIICASPAHAEPPVPPELLKQYLKEESLQADIRCRYFKDYDGKSYLVFTNKGECAAWNIKIEGLDYFHVRPRGTIPAELDINDDFKLGLFLITKESGRMVTLSVSWADNSSEENQKELYVTLT